MENKDIFILEEQEVFGEIAIKIEYVGDNREKDATLNYMGKNICDGEPIFVNPIAAAEIRDWVFKKNKEHKEKHNEIWRALLGNGYYYIKYDLEVAYSCECNDATDNSSYNSYNYFKEKEQAEEASKRIKGLLKRYHEELKKCNM